MNCNICIVKKIHVFHMPCLSTCIVQLAISFLLQRIHMFIRMAHMVYFKSVAKLVLEVAKPRSKLRTN